MGTPWIKTLVGTQCISSTMGCDALGFGNVQVRMLSADEELNEETLRGILQAGHSRVPVHRPGSR